MLLALRKYKPIRSRGLFAGRGRARASASSIERQAIDLNVVKRTKWSEADVDALPAGEHDYFERKSGQLFADIGELLGALAKGISAMANSGGGHIILGVSDSGVPDGVPQLQGAAPVRDWLEQKIPHLVDYPLSDFRVHVVDRSSPTRIPAARDVIVIDVGDSALAPHQCAHGGSGATKYMYYHRRAGRSEPAPHFFVELLRQRLVAPVLQAVLSDVVPVKAANTRDGLFFALRLRFLVKNRGRVAAYKWALSLTEVGGHSDSRLGDYRFRSRDYPAGWSMPSSIRVDDTILPGCALDEDVDIGVFLRPTHLSVEGIKNEIDTLMAPLVLRFRIATEVAPGDVETATTREVVDVHRLAEFVFSAVA